MQLASDVIGTQILAVAKERAHAERSLSEVLAMRDATEVMRDRASEAVAGLNRKLSNLRSDFEAAIAAEDAAMEQPQAIAVSASDLYALVEASKAYLRRSQVLEVKHGVSWTCRADDEKLRAVIDRVSGPAVGTTMEAVA